LLIADVDRSRYQLPFIAGRLKLLGNSALQPASTVALKPAPAPARFVSDLLLSGFGVRLLGCCPVFMLLGSTFLASVRYPATAALTTF
jgi:hypothetical protein